MRVSSHQLLDAAINSIQKQSVEAMKWQQQISSGKKYVKASEDRSRSPVVSKSSLINLNMRCSRPIRISWPPEWLSRMPSWAACTMPYPKCSKWAYRPGMQRLARLACSLWPRRPARLTICWPSRRWPWTPMMSGICWIRPMSLGSISQNHGHRQCVGRPEGLDYV